MFKAAIIEKITTKIAIIKKLMMAKKNNFKIVLNLDC